MALKIETSKTMVAAMGGPALPYGHGRSLLPVARGEAVDWNDEAFSEHCTDVVPAWTGGRATQQRMVRSGACKLIYTHGEAPQLFDVARDPHERHDLAADPSHAQTRDRLLARVLDGWNPDAVANRIAARRRDKEIIAAWARNVRPDDAFRWNLLPEHNRLESQAR